MNEFKPTLLDLFSGIGGFSLAFESVGFKTIGFAEIDPYASAVLKKHWPGVPNYGDVRTITEGLHIRPDVVTGGFPCQPFSSIGKKMCDSDERFLWPELVRILREIRPRFALFENVADLLIVDGGRTPNRVFSDLVSIGYDCIWNRVPACAIGAPHRRDRLWIVAFDSNSGNEQPLGKLPERWWPRANTNGVLQERIWKTTESEVDRVDDGIPNRSHFYHCLGNSIVPQVAQIFAKGIYKILTPY